MKVIDLVCPNCNGAIQLNEDWEYGFCMHCGHRVVLAGSNIGNGRSAQLKRLKTTLDVKAQGRNQKEIVELCDRIIDLDPNDSEAWYYKGMYVLQNGIASEGLPYWTKSVEGMSREEARELYDYMVQAVANALFSGMEDSVPVWNIISLSLAIDEKTDFPEDDESGDFLPTLIDKMIEMTIEDETDPSTVLFRVTTITIVSLSIVNVYISIILNQAVLAAIAEGLETIRDGMNRISFSEPGLLSRDRDEVSRNISFISRVVSEMEHTIGSYTDEEMERLESYWTEHDLDDFMDYLLNARVVDLELSHAGLLSISKLKKERSAKIQEYLDAYFEPLKKGLC